jgi:hypothetical protein
LDSKKNKLISNGGDQTQNIMAEINIIGKAKFVGDTTDVGTSGYKKRELVVTTYEQYPQHILIEFGQDKCNLLNTTKIGDNVNISVNIRGREWINPQGEAKYFNSIQGWRVSHITQAPVQQQPTHPVPAAATFAPATNFSEEEADDLPF